MADLTNAREAVNLIDQAIDKLGDAESELDDTSTFAVNPDAVTGVTEAEQEEAERILLDVLSGGEKLENFAQQLLKHHRSEKNK